MGKFKDLRGQKFGRLVVIKIHPDRAYKSKVIEWICRCDCGNFTTVVGNNLVRGTTSSCGCFFRETLIERNTIHGFRYTPEWHIWAQMVGRCNNPKNKGYHNYGGRGIKIEDERWLKFSNFIADMRLRPSSYLTLERINNDRGYCKDNCTWATRKQQSRNRRNRRQITFNGETRILSEWAEVLGIKFHTLLNRLNRKWPLEKALSPLRYKNQFE